MAKKTTTRKRKVRQEDADEREAREDRVRLARVSRHMDAQNRLVRRIARAIDRNDRQLRALAQRIADDNNAAIDWNAESAPALERPAAVGSSER